MKSICGIQERDKLESFDMKGRDKLENFDMKDSLTAQFFLNIINLL